MKEHKGNPFQLLVFRSYSFGRYPDHVEGLNCRLTGKLKPSPSWTALFITYHYSICITEEAAPIQVSIIYSIFSSLMNKTYKYLNTSIWGNNYPWLRFGGEEVNGSDIEWCVTTGNLPQTPRTPLTRKNSYTPFQYPCDDGELIRCSTARTKTAKN